MSLRSPHNTLSILVWVLALRLWPWSRSGPGTGGPAGDALETAVLLACGAGAGLVPVAAAVGNCLAYLTATRRRRSGSAGLREQPGLLLGLPVRSLQRRRLLALAGGGASADGVAHLPSGLQPGRADLRGAACGRRHDPGPSDGAGAGSCTPGSRCCGWRPAWGWSRSGKLPIVRQGPVPRLGITVALVALLVGARLQALALPGRSPEGGPRQSETLTLDLVQPLLPKLDGSRHVVILSNNPLKFFVGWTCSRRSGKHGLLETDLRGFQAESDDNHPGLQALVTERAAMPWCSSNCRTAASSMSAACSPPTSSAGVAGGADRLPPGRAGNSRSTGEPPRPCGRGSSNKSQVPKGKSKGARRSSSPWEGVCDSVRRRTFATCLPRMTYGKKVRLRGGRPRTHSAPTDWLSSRPESRAPLLEQTRRSTAEGAAKPDTSAEQQQQDHQQGQEQQTLQPRSQVE